MAFNAIGSNQLRGNISEEKDYFMKNDDIPSVSDSELTKLSPGQCITLTTIVVVLCGLSVVGNMGALYANQKRKLRLFFRICLISLALSDLIQTVFMSAGYLAQFGAPYVQVWCLGEVMCIFIPFVTTGAILAGSMTLVGIAMDRYFAVMSSVLGSWSPSRAFCIVSVSCMWAMSYGIASPMYSAYTTYEVYIQKSLESEWEKIEPELIGVTLVEMCVSEKKTNAYYYIVVLAIIFIPTMVAFVWLNSVIANKLWIRRHSLNAPPPQQLRRPEAPTRTPTTTSLPATLGSRKQLQEKLMGTTQQQYQYEGEDQPCHCHQGVHKICAYSTLTVPTNSMVATTTTTITTTTTMKSLERENHANNAKSNSSAGGNSAKHISSREARHLRMFAIVLILMAVFIFFRLPAWVFLIMRMYGTYTRPVHWILHFSFGILTLTSCVLNPLLYTFLAETIHFTLFMKGKLCGLRHYFEDCVGTNWIGGSHCCYSSDDNKDNDKMTHIQIQKQLQNVRNQKKYDNDDDDDDCCCKDGANNDGAKSTSRKSDDDSIANVYTIPVLQREVI